MTQDRCHVLRLQVPSAARADVRVGLPGLWCIGLPAQAGNPALVLVADEAQNNPGASATNSLAVVLPFLRRAWDDIPGLRIHDANIVEQDSEGRFDLVQALWLTADHPSIGWAPVRWPLTMVRSRAAFEAAFGKAGRQVLVTLDRVRTG